MKEELQGKLVEILTSIQAAAGKASDFAIEQLPDIAQSYVAYGRASTTLFVVIGLLAMIAVLYVTYRLDQSWKEDDDSYPVGLAYLGGAIVSVLPALIVISNISSMLLVWVAPKVWLLKEIAGLVR